VIKPADSAAECWCSG